jgi:hypothetical protein
VRSVILRRAVIALMVALHLGTGALATARLCCDHESMLLECCRKAGPGHSCPFSERHGGHGVATGAHLDRLDPHGAHGGPGHDARDESAPRVQMACGAGHDVGVPVLGVAGLPPVPDPASLRPPRTDVTPAAAVPLRLQPAAPAAPPPRA